MATDPRDKIFALLGITFDGPSLVPFPDYHSSLKDILVKLTHAILIAERSLNLICIRSPYPPVENGLPSWTPPWLTNSEFSFWSKPLTIIESSLLSERPKVPGLLILGLDTGHPSLIVQGVILDEVYALSSVLGSTADNLEQCDTVNQARLDKNIESFYPSGPGNAIWQALCIDHTFHPVKRDNGYYSARSAAIYRSCFAKLWTEHGAVSNFTTAFELQDWLQDNADLKIGKHTISEWATKGTHRVDHTPAELAIFCNTLTVILKSSLRLAVTGLGYLGMVPSQTRRGDKICFLRGCSVDSEGGGGRLEKLAAERMLARQRKHSPVPK